MAVTSAFTSISTVLRSLSDDVVRNLERFTCFMYSSSTEQTEVNMLQKEQFTIWEQTTRKSASNEGERERTLFYLTTHSTYFIYDYMASDIWLRTILIVRKEIRCRHIGYSYRLTARVHLYAPSHRQDNTYHGLCYTSRGALAGTRNSSMGPPHEGSIRCPTKEALRQQTLRAAFQSDHARKNGDSKTFIVTGSLSGPL